MESNQNESVDKRVKWEPRFEAQAVIFDQALDLTRSRIWQQIAAQVKTQPRVLDPVIRQLLELSNE